MTNEFEKALLAYQKSSLEWQQLYNIAIVERDALKQRAEAAEADRDREAGHLRDMLRDYRLEFDDHTRGRIGALSQFMYDLRAERDALRKDAALLDAFQAEHERFDPVCALVVKVKHDRNGSDWANVAGDVRAALDAALSAPEVQP
jgi:hypothetical protein